MTTRLEHGSQVFLHPSEELENCVSQWNLIVEHETRTALVTFV
jgi:hypothetical protein